VQWRTVPVPHGAAQLSASAYAYDAASRLLKVTSGATTERYLCLTITDLTESHAEFHPREKECEVLSQAVPGGTLTS